MRILFLVGLLAFGFLIICIAGVWLGGALVIAAGLEWQVTRWRSRHAVTAETEVIDPRG